MPALTAAQIETIIENLRVTYTTLTQELSDSQSSPVGASITFKNLQNTRKEIEAWEVKLDQVSAGTNRFPVSTYGTPA